MKYCIYLLNSGWHCYVAGGTKEIILQDRLIFVFMIGLS